MRKVNFSTEFGDEVSFDENGDALPIYDVMNWLQLPDGKIKIQSVGEVKKSDSGGEELTLNEDKIFWNTDSKKVFLIISFFAHAFHMELKLRNA